MTQGKTKMLVDGEDASHPHTNIIHMESLNEKLKLLKYEREFCRARHQKPLSRHYFAIPTNPGEQFHNFTSLAAWLISNAGGKIDTPQEFDDPNATIADILDAVRSLGYSVEFSPSKLKSGCGEYCLSVLRMLAESALKILGFRGYKLPHYPEEAEEEPDVDNAEQGSTIDEDISEWLGQTDGGKCIGNRLNSAENDQSILDDDDDDEILDLEALRSRGPRAQVHTKPIELNGQTPEPTEKSLFFQPTSQSDSTENISGKNGILESETNPFEWQLEVERVLPQLRVHMRNDSKDWRTHLEDMHRYKHEIARSYTDVRTMLSRLQEELKRALEKIHTREKYMNSQVGPVLKEYKTIQDRLSDVTSKYRQASGGINERRRVLAELNEELERIKNEMEERGSSMTDGSPVVRIKQAIQRLKTEIVGMDIRTGVLEHTLLRAHLRMREDSQRPLFTNNSHDGVANTDFVY